GMVDAHLHTWETGLKAIGCDWRQGEYLRDVFAGMSTYFEPADNHIATLAGALSRLDAGVPAALACCHNVRSSEQAERSVGALEESGVRSVGCLGSGVYRADQQPTDAQSQRIHPPDRAELVRKRLSNEERLVTMS